MTLFVTMLLLAVPDAGAVSTRTTMRGAFEALVTLETIGAVPGGLRDAKNTAAVSTALGTLVGLEHAFPTDAKSQEPATAALSALFSTYAKETRRRFERHDTDAVALRVRTLTGLCFTCHTRERVAADFTDVAARLDALGTTGLRRAQLLAATRQFDEALGEYHKLLDAPASGERGVLETSRALQDALAVLVRVKDDPTRTLAFLETAGARKDLAPFLRGNVAAWKKAVVAWKAEKFDAQKTTPAALFTKAQALVKRSGGTGGPFDIDERQDITWLRASAYLNLALAKDPKLATRGEALYLLGVCAAELRSPQWWDVDLLFFEACVRENPKTKVARRCFQQLSDRVYLGYTGSAGTFIPEDELARLSELRALAE